jgi:hypothetical protein
MREQTEKMWLQDFATSPRDWTPIVTTLNSCVSENGREKRNIEFRKIKRGLSTVFEGTELTSSKLTLNL